MAVPRPLLLALMGTVLLAVTFMATISSREKATDDTASSPGLEQQPAPAAPKQQAGLAPVDVAKAVFTPGKPIDSASFDIRLNAQELGGGRERDALRLTGSFEGGKAGQVPSFDVKTSEVDAGKATHTHVSSTGDKGFLFKGDTGYALAPRYLKGIATFREGAAKGKQVTQPDPSSWLTKLKSEGSVKLDGVDTTHVSAAIDPKRASADVRRLVKSVAGATDQPVKLPRNLDGKVKKVLRSARFEAWIGTEDRIVRRMSIDVRGKFPPEMLDKGDTARWHMGLDVNLTKVNKPQGIDAPAKVGTNPKRALGKRARTDRGTWTLGALFLDPPASLTQTTVGMIQASQQANAARKPRAVSRAVSRHKRVVIFFHQPGGLDDAITDDAVNALRKRSSAVVFQDVVTNVAGYGQVVMSVGVTRAPSIVIIGKSGRARLIEGFIDTGALAQEVADTR
jgi:hypothetical protein